MKRIVPSFTVEVRRQTRRGGHASPNASIAEAKPLRTVFDRDALRAAAAVFEPKKLDQPVAEVVQPPSPRGRILPSLIIADLPDRGIRDAAPAAERAPKKGRTNPPRSRPISASPTVEETDMAAATFAAPSAPSKLREETAPSSKPVASPSPARGNAWASTKRAKAKLGATKPAATAGAQMPPPAARRETTVAEDATPSRRLGEVPKRKRTIMGRYVFGDELKPGERWKRLLRKTR